MDPELRAQLERLGELTDDELEALAEALRAAADELLDGEATDEGNQALAEIAEAIDQVEAQQATRAEDAARRQAERDELAARIRGEDAEAEGDEDAEADATASDTGDGDADGGEQDDEDGDEDEGAGDGAPEAVAADATPPPARQPRVSRVAARRPAAVRPRASTSRQLTLTAAGNVGGMARGQAFESPEDFARAMLNVWESTTAQRGGLTKVPVARIGHSDLSHYPEDRRLGRDPVENMERIAAVTSLEALTASGGTCAPYPVSYELPGVAVNDRPVRDALARFGADRSGIRFFPPLTFNDPTSVRTGVDKWTEDNDRNPGSDGPATKPVTTMVCPDESTVEVYAVTKRLRVGNFNARFFPELVAAYNREMDAWHARFAETELLDAIGAGSTQVDVGQVLGTARDVLAAIDRLVAARRSWHRMSPMQPFRFLLPFWLRDMIRTDIARQLPVGTVEETLAVADATIDRFFAVRNVNTSWYLDTETGEGQQFGAQGAGPAIGWPSTVVGYLYPEGAWLFLDGGTLDVGIIRDSDLVDTNDFEIFMETFENAAMTGVESLKVQMDVCPDGSVSATVDINPCATGS